MKLYTLIDCLSVVYNIIIVDLHSKCDGEVLVCSEYEGCDSCIWSVWREFDECTELCGGGTQKRSRDAVGAACKITFEEEYQDCNVEECIRK